MAWLLRGVLPLLLLAVSGHAKPKSLKLEFESFEKITSVDGLINYDKDVTVGFLNEILVTKYCFRDWIEDQECKIHKYEAAAAGKDHDVKPSDAEHKYKEGFDADNRIKKQMAEINSHISGLRSDGAVQKFLNTLGNALQRNMKEMVKEIVDLDVLNQHLNSEEFDNMFKNIAFEVLHHPESKAGNTTEQAMKHEVARVVYSQWLQDERDKMYGGALEAFNARNSHHDPHREWEKAMNKIPETLKYRTRGATPFVKHHLASKLAVMQPEQYKELKLKSQAYLQRVAEQMRHEAMAKSDSIISLVIHSKDHGEMMMKLNKLVQDRGPKPKMQMNHGGSKPKMQMNHGNH